MGADAIETLRIGWSAKDRGVLLTALDEGKPLPADIISALRLTYQMSLWLMATELCDVPLHEAIHRDICENFFIQKDPRKPIEEQSDIRERLFLFPRHGWKTTIDSLDCVNWILSFPLVRIVIQTGDTDLAEAIVGVVKSYFVVPGWDGARDVDSNPIWNELARPSNFQRLFPEHCVTENTKGAEDFFTTPARKFDRFNPKRRKIADPTIYAMAIESNTSGWRCEVMKNDDILTDNNIRTSARVKTIHGRFNMSHKLLPWWGYRDTIGTRYENDDTYGKLMEAQGLNRDGAYGSVKKDGQFHYYCLPAWWILGTGPEGEGKLKNTYEAPSLDTPEENCGFLDKTIWPYKALHDDMKMDPKIHASQYLNNPVLAGEADFTREGMLKCFIDWTKLPTNEFTQTFAVVDLAYSDKRGRDFTVIAVGTWYNDALWVKDIIRGRFKPEEMPEVIVGVIRDYPEIKAMGIEESVGAKWLKPDIFAAAERQGIVLPPIEWISLGQGEKDAKDNRIKGLVPLYKSGRLLFLDNIQAEPDEVIKEFTSSRGKRDIPDAVSRLRKYQTQSYTIEDKKTRIEQRRKLREQEEFDMIYGQGRHAYREPPTPVVTAPELEPEPDTRYDAVTGLPEGDFYGSIRY